MVSGSRVLGIAAILLVAGSGCGRVTSHFSSHDTSRKGTMSAVPPSGPVGTAFALHAAGLKPGEAMTFEVDPPKGKPFIGPPHTAGPDGTVSSTFTPQAGDTPGTYKLKATGDMGTRATGTLVIEPGAAPTTTTTTTRRHR
jgi:hypothetical protein